MLFENEKFSLHYHFFQRGGEGNGWRWFEAEVIIGILILRDRAKKTIKLSQDNQNLFLYSTMMCMIIKRLVVLSILV